MKKKRFDVQGMLAVLVMAAAGGICGYMLTETAAGDPFKKLSQLPLFFIGLYATIYIQIILHEAGHLLFGLLSGYSFVSFRVGSLVLARQDGKLSFSRYSLPGTAGQCLMAPPELVDGRMPVVMYNFGGVITNAASALVLFPVSDITGSGLLALFLYMNAVIGAAFALLNGVPLRFAQVDNDGKNALSLGKSKSAMRGLWVQLAVNAELTRGKRLKELPDEWFKLPTDDELKNSMAASAAVISCNRLMDKAELDEASVLMKRLLEMETGMVGLHRYMLQADVIFCELMTTDAPEIVMDKNMKSMMKTLKKLTSVLRTKYALALLDEGDEAKAEKLFAEFDKATKNYPYSGDAASERELMRLALERWRSRQTNSANE